MIKEREPALERISVSFQVIQTLLCFYFILWISGYFDSIRGSESKEHLIMFFIIVPVWFVLLELFEMGAMERIQRYRHIIRKYALVISIGTFILYFLANSFDYGIITIEIATGFAIVNFIVMTSVKLTGRMAMKYFRRKGYNSRMILIIADASSVSFIQQVIDSDDWGYRIWGIISDSEEIKLAFGKKFSIYSENYDFSRLIDEKVIDEVFFCKQDFNMELLKDLIRICREVGVNFNIHNQTLSFLGFKPSLYFLNHQFFLSFRNRPENYFALQIKFIIDLFLAIIILIIISPIMLLIALAIRLDDKGPVFFKQVRVGRHGRLFKCLKFRTMVVNAEAIKDSLRELNEQEGPVFKIKNDPRITRVGKFLRKTSLDELPQFINVLFGEMSIVGPRPPVPSEVKQYKRSLNRRLSINPGITCIWQVSGRNNIPFDKWMEMDMEYIDNWSLSLDFMIILKTFKVFFARNGQ